MRFHGSSSQPGNEMGGGVYALSEEAPAGRRLPKHLKSPRTTSTTTFLSCYLVRTTRLACGTRLAPGKVYTGVRRGDTRRLRRARLERRNAHDGASPHALLSSSSLSQRVEVAGANTDADFKALCSLLSPSPGRRQDCDGRPDPIRGATGARRVLPIPQHECLATLSRRSPNVSCSTLPRMAISSRQRTRRCALGVCTSRSSTSYSCTRT